MPGSSPSVLIIRLDAIGDALALTPLLAALRERSIPVDLVLRDANAEIFSSRAARRVFTAPFALRSSKRANLEAIAAFGAELRENAYTHVLVATEDPGGYRLAGAVGAPVRVGFSNAWGKPLKSLWVRRFLTRTVYRSAAMDRSAPHECEVLFELGRELAGEAAPTRDAAQLRPLVLESEPAADDRVAVQITDKWERLGIAFDGVAELVRRAGEFGARLVCSRAEAAYAAEISQATGAQVELFASIRAWKTAIAACAAVVAPDSGALHVAGMTGTPVVAVFPPSKDFDLQVARWSPWAAPHRIVRAEGAWPKAAADALVQLL